MAVITILITVPAAAQVQSISASLARMDVDKDGKLSLAEWAADSAAIFKKTDADKDGAIVRGEAVVRYQKGGAAADPKLESRVAKIMAPDTNGDGQVSAAEAKIASDAEFKKRDKNGDGFIGGDDAAG
ncbi:EF-hand domain-containing protein [Sphingomonas sp. M1-B02]|uniref:EF-hand domain-containing protein n=1 Tax=Sphingomonas sp. M1-B02 TaxID=3114300 RepID=UPI00223F7B43|nr:hypothetical protein [Sphingomonas sp. S6-11]UZK67318.1 hypothetical protein OKW87_05645 [Sphingomonas sp. S6-11]